VPEFVTLANQGIISSIGRVLASCLARRLGQISAVASYRARAISSGQTLYTCKEHRDQRDREDNRNSGSKPFPIHREHLLGTKLHTPLVKSFSLFSQPAEVWTAAWSVIFPLLQSGAVKPIVAKTFPLAEAADALRYLVEGRPLGRVVLTI
jgi:NADPH:quinone reductase-like Zn-dependent oxidoreductase